MRYVSGIKRDEGENEKGGGRGVKSMRNVT